MQKLTLPMNDTYILSDLHLGEGRSPESRRFARLESFFYDQEFANFIDRVIVESMVRRNTAHLILNGDIFDFLTLIRVPDSRVLRTERFRLHRSEYRFGLGSSAAKSAWKIERIVRGHPGFFLAILRFLEAGHRITIIRGNHDVELYWGAVQEKLVTTLADIAKNNGFSTWTPEKLAAQLTIEQWFYYEPDRMYIEHGHQYDAGNSFRFPFNPVLPSHLTGEDTEILDYPTGSIFVRMMYNKLKQVDPFSTHFVSLDRYLVLFGRATFIDIIRALTLHFPFFFRAIKAARFFELHGMDDVARLNDQRIAEYSRKKNMPTETIQLLAGLMREPVGKTKYSLVQEAFRPVIRATATFSAIALLSVSAWFLLFTLIQGSGLLTSGLFLRASLLGILAVATVAGLFVLFTTVHRKIRTPVDPSTVIYFQKAEEIAKILKVPIVAMGHNHTADLRPFKKCHGFYANSGTWILTHGPWDVIKPKSRQFTFVRVWGHDVEVMRWDDTVSRWEPVHLLEDYSPSPLERLIRDGEDNW
ncbi:MAG: hypothetical protein HUU55_12555 [Myxococcales bacterium]|nr:hypothetical protein [Myxococcales bacterium]